MKSSRPLCTIEGCRNLAMTGARAGSPFRELCTTHHKKKYGMPCNASPKYKLRLNPEVGKCSLCGWDKAPCDLHRITAGNNGGKYEKSNVVVVCPNCHRLIHRGLLHLDIHPN